MASLKKDSQRNRKVNLVAGILFNIVNFDNTKPQVIQVRNNGTTDSIYMGESSNVDVHSHYSVIAGGVKVFVFPQGLNGIYLLCNSNNILEISSWECDDITPADLEQTQTVVIVNSTVSSQVLVEGIVNPLPVGTNHIGEVSLQNNTLGISGIANPLPTGGNHIGVVTLDNASIHTTIDSIDFGGLNISNVVSTDGQFLVGLTADVKPISGVLNGTTWYNVDDKSSYIFLLKNTTWYLL